MKKTWSHDFMNYMTSYTATWSW